MLFADRIEAGRKLAQHLQHLQHLTHDNVVVLGLPRGGVPVAYEVARALHAPLDVIVVRKLGVPFQPELAMGAIGEGGTYVINEDVMQRTHVTSDELAAVETRELAELERRARQFRSGRSRTDIHGRTVLIVDDGIATGSTARAACQVARAQGASKVILTAPVAPADVGRRFAADVDDVVVYATPEPFFGVGQFYDDFSQTTDKQVIELLEAASRAEPPPAETIDAGTLLDDPPLRSEEI